MLNAKAIKHVEDSTRAFPQYSAERLATILEQAYKGERDVIIGVVVRTRQADAAKARA